MRYTADVTESRSYTVEIEADSREMANELVLERIGKGIRPKDGYSERVTVEFNKKDKGWKQR